jgi:hypothetical protein
MHRYQVPNIHPVRKGWRTGEVRAEGRSWGLTEYWGWMNCFQGRQKANEQAHASQRPCVLRAPYRPVQSKYHLLKKLAFLLCVFLAPVSMISWLSMCGVISVLSVLFLSSICVSLCQCLTVLINVALWYILKSWYVIPSTLFFLKVDLALQSAL